MILLIIDERITRLFPNLNAAQKYLGVLISHGNVFGCLTSSAGFLLSPSVEDDLLVL